MADGNEDWSRLSSGSSSSRQWAKGKGQWGSLVVILLWVKDSPHRKNNVSMPSIHKDRGITVFNLGIANLIRMLGKFDCVPSHRFREKSENQN